MFDIITTQQGWEFLLRWFHFLAGITWIGVLYYFNLVQTPFLKGGPPKEVASGVTRGILPRALWWFRWGAMFTFLTGWTIVFLRIGQGQPHATQTLIMAGGLIGTLMWANVWFVIWPAQQVVIQSAEQVAAGGQAIPEAAARGARAGLTSRTNFVLSFPMLFFMGAQSHYPVFNLAGGVGGFLGAVVVVLALFELNIFYGNAATQKPFGSVKGAIHLGVLATILYYLIAKLLLA